MNQHITVLEDSRLITDYESLWEYLLLLAANLIKRTVPILILLFGDYSLAIGF